jgi:hypothetical protein
MGKESRQECWQGGEQKKILSLVSQESQEDLLKEDTQHANRVKQTYSNPTHDETCY